MRTVEVFIVVGTLSLGHTLGGCGLLQPTQARPASPAVKAKFGADASVVDVGYASGKTISVKLLPPVEQGYKQFDLLSVVHHWTANDIFRYTATLTAWNGTAFTAIGSGVSTIVDPKALTPQTKAVFTNLKQGTKYLVSIVASGNDGGTAATLVLNDVNPTNLIYDFSASQDVQNILSNSVAITFDAVSFNGKALTTLTTPPDGAYANPTATEAGTAQ